MDTLGPSQHNVHITSVKETSLLSGQLSWFQWCPLNGGFTVVGFGPDVAYPRTNETELCL